MLVTVAEAKVVVVGLVVVIEQMAPVGFVELGVEGLQLLLEMVQYLPMVAAVLLLVLTLVLISLFVVQPWYVSVVVLLLLLLLQLQVEQVVCWKAVRVVSAAWVEK